MNPCALTADKQILCNLIPSFALAVVKGDSVTCLAMQIVKGTRALCRCGVMQQGFNFRPEAVLTYKFVNYTTYCVRTAVYVCRMVKECWGLAS